VRRNANRKQSSRDPIFQSNFRNHTSRKEQFMHSAESQAPAEMNWVDYCDSLSNAKFVQHAKVPPIPFTAKDIPDHTAFVASVREAMRDLK
jgi:hypothetical protein